MCKREMKDGELFVLNVAMCLFKEEQLKVVKVLQNSMKYWPPEVCQSVVQTLDLMEATIPLYSGWSVERFYLGEDCSELPIKEESGALG